MPRRQKRSPQPDARHITFVTRAKAILLLRSSRNWDKPYPCIEVHSCRGGVRARCRVRDSSGVREDEEGTLATVTYYFQNNSGKCAAMLPSIGT